MTQCPRCGSTRVYLSRHRGFAERLRQVFTAKRPHRCHACNWRAWVRVEVRGRRTADFNPEALRRAPAQPALTADELDRLDLGQPAPPRPAERAGPLTEDDFEKLDPTPD